MFGGLDPSRAELEEQRQERTTQALDKLRTRFGAGTVVPGSLLSRASLRVRAREGEKPRA